MPEVDHDEVVRTAEQSASGNSSLFSTALGYLTENKVRSSLLFLAWRQSNIIQKAHEEPLDDEEVTRAHDKVYNQNDASGLSSKLLGSAAALEVRTSFFRRSQSFTPPC